MVSLSFFFYSFKHFASILILGAQINAFYYEHYKPLSDGLGTYVSRMYHDYGEGDPHRPLLEEESDIPQQQITTNNREN